MLTYYRLIKMVQMLKNLKKYANQVFCKKPYIDIDNFTFYAFYYQCGQ